MSHQFALTKFREELRYRGEDWFKNRAFQKFRFGHYFVVTELGNRYYILYKEEFYHSGDYEFNKSEGYWESINKEALERALKLNTHRLLFVRPDGKIYEISPRIVKEMGNERTQEGGEITISFPINELMRWN